MAKYKNEKPRPYEGLIITRGMKNLAQGVIRQAVTDCDEYFFSTQFCEWWFTLATGSPSFNKKEYLDAIEKRREKLRRRQKEND